ncbi:DUF4263 domain-containing protein [bacterium]|nr:DUF4263 domain-containing protein [bacterium]
MKDIKLIKIKKLKTKEIYHVSLDGKDTGFKGCEKYKNGTIKRFPYYERDGIIIQKYDSIKCITTSAKTQPKSGISTNESKGFGFTNPKGVASFFYYFQNRFPNVSEVEFIASGKTKILGNKLHITLKDFYALEKQTDTFVKAKRNEGENLYQRILSTVFPKKISPPDRKKYVPGSLSGYLKEFINIELSSEDQLDLKEVFVNSELSTETLISTRTELDIVYFEDVIEEFEKLYCQVTETNTLEERWQTFFKKHTWIFSQIFSFPAVFLKDKVNVGGHSISGNTDKVVDFLYKNKITNNIAFIEIKTHLASITNRTPYRKPNIFSISPALSGAIVQVLDQRNRLLKNFHSIVGDSGKSLNSTCVVVAGDTKSLKKKGQKESFELFRWSNKDVIIIPFDELIEKVKILLSIFKKQ